MPPGIPKDATGWSLRNMTSNEPQQRKANALEQIAKHFEQQIDIHESHDLRQDQFQLMVGARSS